MKKLIETRNARFEQAIDEWIFLLLARIGTDLARQVIDRHPARGWSCANVNDCRPRLFPSWPCGSPCRQCDKFDTSAQRTSFYWTSYRWHDEFGVVSWSSYPSSEGRCKGCSNWLETSQFFVQILWHLFSLDTLNPPISQAISDAVLCSKSIKSLFSHQVAAINSIRSGKHVVVSTSTASGKSIIYQVSPLVAIVMFFVITS